MRSLEEGYRDKRVVILGAAGFVGRHVRGALHEMGAEITGVDQPGCAGDLVGLDVTRSAALDRFLRRNRPHIVLNLAGYGVSPDQQDEGLARALNAELPDHLCAALDGTGAMLVHVGSAFEYGGVGGDLEEDGPAAPTSVYGKTKLAGTEAVRRWGRDTGLHAVTARLFTVYGPGEQPHRLLPSLFRAVDSGEILPMTAGEQLRDFTYVGDVADGLCLLGLTGGKPGEVINLATGVLTPVREFAEIAARAIGLPERQLGFGAVDSRPDEMAHAPPTLVRLRRRTGWTPPTRIEDGVRLTAESGTV